MYTNTLWTEKQEVVYAVVHKKLCMQFVTVMAYCVCACLCTLIKKKLCFCNTCSPSKLVLR